MSFVAASLTKIQLLIIPSLVFIYCDCVPHIAITFYHLSNLIGSFLRVRVACLQTLGRPHVRPMRPPWTDAHRHTLAQTKIAKFDVECILRAKTLTGMGR